MFMKYVFQIIGFAATVLLSIAATIFYIGYAKKQAETEQSAAAKIVKIESPELAAVQELTPLEPVSVSHKVREKQTKQKSKPTKKTAWKPAKVSDTGIEPETYSAPAKVAAAKVPPSKKRVAPTKKETKRMVAKAAEKERLHYGASPETKAAIQSLPATIRQWTATDNQSPTTVQRAKWSSKIAGAGMSDTEREAKHRVEMERLKAGVSQFRETGEMAGQK